MNIHMIYLRKGHTLRTYQGTGVSFFMLKGERL